MVPFYIPPPRPHVQHQPQWMCQHHPQLVITQPVLPASLAQESYQHYIPHPHQQAFLPTVGDSSTAVNLSCPGPHPSSPTTGVPPYPTVGDSSSSPTAVNFSHAPSICSLNELNNHALIINMIDHS